METSIKNGFLYINNKKVVKFYQNDNELKFSSIINLNQCNNTLLINGSQIHKVIFEDDTTQVFDKVVQNGNVILQDVTNSIIRIN